MNASSFTTERPNEHNIEGSKAAEEGKTFKERLIYTYNHGDSAGRSWERGYQHYKDTQRVLERIKSGEVAKESKVLRSLVDLD